MEWKKKSKDITIHTGNNENILIIYEDLEQNYEEWEKVIKIDIFSFYHLTNRFYNASGCSISYNNILYWTPLPAFPTDCEIESSIECENPEVYDLRDIKEALDKINARLDKM